jgi:arylsulfatase A-like enzyme
VTRTLPLLLAVLAPVSLVAAVVGLFFGASYISSGFPLLAVDAVRRSLDQAVLGTIVFVVLYAAARRLLGDRLGDRWGLAAAAWLAAAPFVAVVGYRLNRARAVKISEILEPWALVPNLWLLTGCGVLWAAACLLLSWAESKGERRPWGAVTVAVVLALLHGGLAFAYSHEVKKGPDVLILLVDALRADHLGCYGYDRETSPAIDRLASEGVVFGQAISQSTFTKTSIASLFTGKNPYRHGIYWGQRRLTGDSLTADVLRDEETTLAEAFADAGYLTGAWVQNSHLRRLMGFGQGFMEYHDQQGSIEQIHHAFSRFLSGPARRYSTFAYLHYIDLHDPYRPTPPYDTFFGTPGDVYENVDFSEWGAYLNAVHAGEETLSADDVETLRLLYDGQMRAIDTQIGQLLDELRRQGLYDRTLIVVTADHGDGFMEHGFISHSTTPYDELARVPLVVKFPEGRFAGRKVAAQVRLVDLLPTLLEVAGVAVPDDVDGCNLLPRLTGKAEDEDDSCGLAVIEIAEDDDSAPTLALRNERFKYIHRPGSGDSGSGDSGSGDELYDLVEDPGEQQNLVYLREDDAKPLRELARRLVEQRQTEVESLALDSEMIRQLKALGYVGLEKKGDGS